MTRAAAPASTHLSQVLRDSFLRNSVLLILNYAISGLIGFAFWAVAARSSAAAEIGNVSALLSGLTFVAVAAGLGFQNTIVRYLASEPDQRALVVGATSVVGLVGGFLTLVVLAVPGHVGLPVLTETGVLGDAVVVGIVVLLATGAVADAAIIGFRATGTIVVKNAIAGGLRIALLPVVAGSGEPGLLVCIFVSIGLATFVSLVVGLRRAHRRVRQPNPFKTLSGKVRFSAGNYVAMLLSIGPLSVLPVFVVNVHGAVQGAYFSVSILIIIALNAVPSTISQSLFAELAASPQDRARLIRRAFRIAYSLMGPIVLVIAALAPVLLGLFGDEYTAATTCLRLMALGGLFGAFNYIADVLLNAAGRIGVFTVVNVTGAVAVLAATMVLGTRGLTWVGVGWLAGQIFYSMLAGTALVRCGLVGGRSYVVVGPET